MIMVLVWGGVLVGVLLGAWFIFRPSASKNRTDRPVRVDPPNEVASLDAATAIRVPEVPAPPVVHEGAAADPAPLREPIPPLVEPEEPEPAPPEPIPPPEETEPAAPEPSPAVEPAIEANVEPLVIEVAGPSSVAEAQPVPPEAATPDAQEAPKVPQVPEVAAVALAPLIFVVDDSTVVRTKLLRLLHKAGYRTAIAGDGHEALTLFEMDLPALMITDIEMPTMDGHELIARLQESERTRGVPIFALSGHEGMEETLRGRPGVMGVHKKPWENEALLAGLLEHAGPGHPAESGSH